MLTRRTTLATGGAALLAAPAVHAAGERRVVFWHGYTQQARTDQLRALARQFEADNPGATVAIEVVPYAGFADKWAAASAAGALPDVTALDARAAVPMAVAGALNPVDDLLKALGGAAAFEPGLLDMVGRYRGKYIVVPHSVEDRLLVYRRDRLTAAGLDVPVTWDDLLQATAAMTKAPDYFGWIMKLGRAGNGAGELLWTMTRSAGGSFFDDDGNVTFDQPPVRDAVDFMVDLAKRAGTPPGMADAQPADNVALITSSRASMAAAPAGLIGQVVAKDPDLASKLEAVPMPIRVRVGNLLSGVSVALPKGKNPQDGQRLASLLFAEKTYVPLLLATPLTLFPALHGTEAAFQADPVVAAHPDAVRATFDGVATGSLPGMERGLNPYAGPVFDSHLIEDMMQAIVLNGANTADAITDATRKMAGVLRTTKDKLSRT